MVGLGREGESSSEPLTHGRKRLPHQLLIGTRLAGLVFVGVAVGNCAGPPGSRTGNKYGVSASPRVVAEGDPVPKGGGREMVGKPYQVAGRTYVPHDGKSYNREGWASWYGTAFHGRLTANGEVFDRDSVAAAHPTLPLPSYVRVTNLSNGRSLIVRVNDRGPYEYDRLIDLSERAADALAFKRKGTTRVRVQYVGKASVSGSDDAKLLATLRTDGSAAPVAPVRSGGTALASVHRPSAEPLTPARRVAFAANSADRGPAGLPSSDPRARTGSPVDAAAPRNMPSRRGAAEMAASDPGLAEFAQIY